MDLNGDGRLDLLSGTYSKNDGDMAGVLYALFGTESGFQGAEPLLGEEEELLLIHTERSGVNRFADRICTKPWAADLNGDGRLDLVVGNMVGHFAYFQGKEEGGFEARSSFLVGEDDQRLVVGRHSDPVLVDWDGDGDLDLLSGSDAGGISLFGNVGTATAPRFGAKRELLAEFDIAQEGLNAPLLPAVELLDRPGQGSRIAVQDFDGDGALDIVLTDRTEILLPAEGLSMEDCEAALRKSNQELSELGKTLPDDPLSAENSDALDDYNAKQRALLAKRDKLVRTSFVAGAWLLRGKGTPSQAASNSVR